MISYSCYLVFRWVSGGHSLLCSEVGDSIWQAADARARGFLIGATYGRTTLNGEGLQHQELMEKLDLRSFLCF